MSGPRPRFQAMLQAVRRGEIDVVLVWAVDRLYRRLADLLELTNALGDVPVYAVRSGDIDLSTADGRLHANLLGSVAQHESEKKAERVRAAAERRARAGRFPGGARRFGYRHSEVDLSTGKRTLELIPAEADAIAWAYRHVTAGGSLEAVCREWRDRGLVGPRGAPFTGVSVRDVLLRPMNGGLGVYRGEIVGKSGAPAIVDEETFRTARAVLSDPRRRTNVGRPVLSLLSGLLRCGVCGARMSSRYRRRGAARGGGKRGSTRAERGTCRAIGRCSTSGSRSWCCAGSKPSSGFSHLLPAPTQFRPRCGSPNSCETASGAAPARRGR